MRTFARRWRISCAACAQEWRAGSQEGAQRSVEEHRRLLGERHQAEIKAPTPAVAA